MGDSDSVKNLEVGDLLTTPTGKSQTIVSHLDIIAIHDEVAVGRFRHPHIGILTFPRTYIENTLRAHNQQDKTTYIHTKHENYRLRS